MIIDFHCHSYFDGINSNRLKGIVERRVALLAARGTPKSAEEVYAGFKPFMVQPYGENIIRAMDEANIDVCCYYGWDNIADNQGDEFALTRNWKDAEVARRYPTRIIAFASIDPRRDKAPELLRRCIEDFGMKGLKILPAPSGYDPMCEEAYRLFSICQDYHLPTVIHTVPGPIGRSRLAHPSLLEDIARDFPDVNIDAAHLGKVWYREWCAVAQQNRNIYGDLSGWQTDAIARYEWFCRSLRELLDLGGSNKVLFGSDWPVADLTLPMKDWVQIIQRLPQDAPSGIQFTIEEVAGILGGNAKRILGF